jgi:hypothetical protein
MSTAKRSGPKVSRIALRPRSFQVIVEQDEAGYFVAECPALKACYTQDPNDEPVSVLLERIRAQRAAAAPRPARRAARARRQ